MKPVGPIYTHNLFPELHDKLIAMLKGLSDEEWHKPTVCDPWTVKDLSAHLLDGYIRRLSFQRDGMPLLAPDRPINSPQELIGFLDQLNADWIRASQRISPPLLIAMLELTGPLVHQLFQALDPQAEALFSVGWAGEASSRNWFDIAREFTEQWLHQQQIREALDRPGLDEPHILGPVIETFMRALPATYQHVAGREGDGFISTSKESRWRLDITERR